MDRKSQLALACAVVAAPAAVLLLARAVAQAPPATPPPLPAEPARLAPQSLLIAVAAAGPRLIAVGDHGIIVLSDDRGGSWTQASLVPSQALLTGVCFLDAAHAVAVGHDEVILLSADAGHTWKLTHYAPEAERPLLDVWCGSGGRAIAVGAYSTYLVSADGGASWSARTFVPAPRARRAGPPPAQPDETAPAAEVGGAGGGYHLNRIVSAGDSRLYLAAEAGHLYRSDDGGASWRTLDSPYAGSFFGVLPLAGESVVAFGLRGNLFRSEDGGASWRRLNTGTVAMLDGGARLAGGTLALVGLSGTVLVSYDDGRNFEPLAQSDRSGLSAAASVGEDELVVVGENGAKLLRVPGAAADPGARPREQGK